MKIGKFWAVFCVICIMVFLVGCASSVDPPKDSKFFREVSEKREKIMGLVKSLPEFEAKENSALTNFLNGARRVSVSKKDKRNLAESYNLFNSSVLELSARYREIISSLRQIDITILAHNDHFTTEYINQYNYWSDVPVDAVKKSITKLEYDTKEVNAEIQNLKDRGIDLLASN